MKYNIKYLAFLLLPFVLLYCLNASTTFLYLNEDILSFNYVKY